MELRDRRRCLNQMLFSSESWADGGRNSGHDELRRFEGYEILLRFFLKWFQIFLLERLDRSESVSEWVDIAASMFDPVIQMRASYFA